MSGRGEEKSQLQLASGITQSWTAKALINRGEEKIWGSERRPCNYLLATTGTRLRYNIDIVRQKMSKQEEIVRYTSDG
jgi:hypothetical protein